MSTTPKLLGALVGLLAISQTGCAGLGIAMIGAASNNGKPLDTAQVLDPSIPTIGGPAQPGNGTVAITVSLPTASAYRTQYAREDLTRVVIGLVDLNASDATKLYFGFDELGPLNSASYLPLMGPTLFTWTAYANVPATDALKRDNKRYLYHNLTGAAGGLNSPTRSVAFTNIKPGTRVFGFAAAFVNGGTQATDLAGIGQTGTALTVQPGLKTLDQITLRLDRNLVEVDGSVTIVPSVPGAQAQ